MPNILPMMMSAAGVAGGSASQGTLWSWGQNEAGDLGIGTQSYATTKSPVQVGTATNWYIIDLENYGRFGVGGSDAAACAVDGDGKLYTWGSGGVGRGGRGNTTSVCVPTQVGAEVDWDTVAGGYQQWATTTGGEWWFLGGDGGQGSNGQGNETDYSSPVQIGSLTYWAKCAGTTGVAYAITNHGSDGGGQLWATGADGYGQLGQNTRYVSVSSPIQVGSDITWKIVTSSGDDTWAIKTDGTMWAWGHNDEGQLGIGNTTVTCSPVQIGSLTTWALVAGDHRGSAFAIKTDGTLWAWGRNVEGQLGLGDTTVRSSPVQVGSLTDWKTVTGCAYSTAATKTDGTLWTWGDGAYGNLGDGGTVDRSSPAQVGSDTDWISVGHQFGWHQNAIRSP